MYAKYDHNLYKSLKEVTRHKLVAWCSFSVSSSFSGLPLLPAAYLILHTIIFLLTCYIFSSIPLPFSIDGFFYHRILVLLMNNL